jgi:hypothetical protein
VPKHELQFYPSVSNPHVKSTDAQKSLGCSNLAPSHQLACWFATHHPHMFLPEDQTQSAVFCISLVIDLVSNGIGSTPQSGLGT